MRKTIFKDFIMFISVLFLCVSLFGMECNNNNIGNNNNISDDTTIKLPNAPTDFSASPVSSSEIALSWTDNSDNETGFRIERAPDEEGSPGSYGIIHTTLPDVNSFTDTGLGVDTTYHYKIYAFNDAGDSLPIDASSGTSGDIGIVPSAPTDFSAISISSSEIALSWTDNSDNEIGFRIKRFSNDIGGSGSYELIHTTSSDENSFNDTGLEPDTTYIYQVCAFNEEGESLPAEASATTHQLAQPIIADHTIVDKYDDIPQIWIDEVKKMYLNIPGESHSFGYRKGLSLLQELDSGYPVIVTESGSPEPYREDALRIDRFVRNQYNSWNNGASEAKWYTWLAWDPDNPEYPTVNANTIKNHISYCNTNNLEIAAIGFGWCWDMTWINGVTESKDPVYYVGWAGTSAGGPDGGTNGLQWGLDDDDYAITGNRVCMETYLNATQEYIEYSNTNGYSTVVLFTTGPVDGGGNINESGYQRWLKHEYIRNHVNVSSDRVLFDYADILCWNNDNERNEITWTNYNSEEQTFQAIHTDNMKDYDDSWNTIPHSEDGDHIGEVGALRLGKALWWLLARVAGWDGQ